MACRAVTARATRVAMPPGSTLIAYTDGLVERRSQALEESLAELLEVTATTETSAPAQICDRLLAFGGESTEIDDDITVVALQFSAGYAGVHDKTHIGPVPS